LPVFAAHCFHELNPLTPFALSWHHELIAAIPGTARKGRPSGEAAVRDGRIRPLITMCRPTLSGILLHILASDWYRQTSAAPLVGAAASRVRVRHHGPGLSARHPGRRGQDADIIIIDDPLKHQEALSPVQRQAANDWFDHTLYSRLNDTQRGATILIMHRLHEACSR
jgi:hypothetical protein